MIVVKKSHCKVNLVLNILSRRPDGFHELETLMHPIGVFDELTLEPGGGDIKLSCSDSRLPTDNQNLVFRAAALFFKTANLVPNVQIHLEKRIPLAAGLGGGSGNAAATLAGLNELFGFPLPPAQLLQLAASLGSDVPFFLQDGPALGTGRGEKIQSLEFFPSLRGCAFFLVHPGFGISTAWAYQQLKRFPQALQGHPGRAEKLVGLLRTGDLENAGREFYNSLEAPALEKYPLLGIFKEFLLENGAKGSLMSGSGSTTFALLPTQPAAARLEEQFKARFGTSYWTAVVPV